LLDAGDVLHKHEVRRVAVKDELLSMRLGGRLVVPLVLPKGGGESEV